MSRPSTRTTPADGGWRPATTRSSVLFPAPLGPSTLSTSPRASSRLVPARAAASPSFVRCTQNTSRSSTTGSLMAEAPPGREPAREREHRERASTPGGQRRPRNYRHHRRAGLGDGTRGANARDRQSRQQYRDPDAGDYAEQARGREPDSQLGPESARTDALLLEVRLDPR